MPSFRDGRNRVNAPTTSNRLTSQEPVATEASEGIARQNYRTLIEPSLPHFLNRRRKWGQCIEAGEIREFNTFATHNYQIDCPSQSACFLWLAGNPRSAGIGFDASLFSRCPGNVRPFFCDPASEHCCYKSYPVIERGLPHNKILPSERCPSADKLIQPDLFVAVHELSPSGQSWTDWKELVVPHSGHDNQNDSFIP
jgi:hypothetical protein